MKRHIEFEINIPCFIDENLPIRVFSILITFVNFDQGFDLVQYLILVYRNIKID